MHVLTWATPFSPIEIGRIEEIAKKKGVSMAQVSLAWNLAKEHVVAPVVGVTSLQHLEDILGKYRVSFPFASQYPYGWELKAKLNRVA